LLQSNIPRVVNVFTVLTLTPCAMSSFIS
jgi:hypothetical protein